MQVIFSIFEILFFFLFIKKYNFNFICRKITINNNTMQMIFYEI